MNIKGTENIRDIFSIFHDGVISHASINGNSLTLVVDIRYLAEKINPSYEKFCVQLDGIRDLFFITWQSDLQSESISMMDISFIFKPELDILQSSIENGLIQVVCNQASTKFDYCGGELYFQAGSAQVIDEAGKHYSIDELNSLCNNYWNDWASKNQA